MSHDILPVVSGNNLRKIWQKLLATFPTRTQVITLIEENAKLKKEIVQELPTENINTNCIYLVPDPNGTARNVYNEYMYIIDEQTQQGNWELIGTTRVDMTQYYTKTQTDRILLDKQNRTDNDLPTESKTITGAISEIFTTLSNFISSAGTAITSLINRVTKLEPIQGTTADIMQKFNDGEIPEGYYAESWDDDVTEFAIQITSEQYEALTEAQKKAFNYLLTDGLPAGMLLMDNYPREGSNNAVKSKGMYEKFEEQQEQINELNTHLTREVSYTATNAYGTFSIKRYGDTMNVSGQLSGIPTNAWTALLSGLAKPIAKSTFVNTSTSGANDVSILLSEVGTISFYGRGVESTCALSIEYKTIE